jgi:hypothetical protein
LSRPATMGIAGGWAFPQWQGVSIEWRITR